MAITRAGAITAAAKAVSKSRENEKRRKSAAKKCKWRERQSAEQQSEIRQPDRIGQTGCDPRWINLLHLRFFLVRFYGLVKSDLFLRRKFAVGVFLRVVLCNMSIKLL